MIRRQRKAGPPVHLNRTLSKVTRVTFRLRGSQMEHLNRCEDMALMVTRRLTSITITLTITQTSAHHTHTIGGDRLMGVPQLMKIEARAELRSRVTLDLIEELISNEYSEFS